MKYIRRKRTTKAGLTKQRNTDLTLESSHVYSKEYHYDSSSYEDGEYTFKPKLMLTTSQLKEKKEFEECTFHPKIKRIKSESTLPQDNSVYDKLYSNSKNLSEKKFFKKIEFMKKESNEYTFKPKLKKSGKLEYPGINKSYDFFDNQKKVILL
jgi:hypothetical protein